MQARFTDRLEVLFDAKPSTQTIGELKRRGFWWDGRARCWWLARPVYVRFVRQEPISQDGFTWALEFLREMGLTAGEADAIRKQADEHAHTMGARGMEMACGIA